MEPLGTASQPLRVAVIGSGPAAFYAAEHLFKQTELVVEVDMFDRLPTPYGLVRVRRRARPRRRSRPSPAPSTPSRRTRASASSATSSSAGTLRSPDLQQHYHQVVFATGAQTDRRMGIPGEDLVGSHPATEFVAWYNGHPDYRDCQFDLSAERAAVVGVGNVAIDVARILVRTPEELARPTSPTMRSTRCGRAASRKSSSLAAAGRRRPPSPTPR